MPQPPALKPAQRWPRGPHKQAESVLMAALTSAESDQDGPVATALVRPSYDPRSVQGRQASLPMIQWVNRVIGLAAGQDRPPVLVSGHALPADNPDRSDFTESERSVLTRWSSRHLGSPSSRRKSIQVPEVGAVSRRVGNCLSPQTRSSRAPNLSAS